MESFQLAVVILVKFLHHIKAKLSKHFFFHASIFLPEQLLSSQAKVRKTKTYAKCLEYEKTLIEKIWPYLSQFLGIDENVF